MFSVKSISMRFLISDFKYYNSINYIIHYAYAMYTESSHCIHCWICSKTKNSNEFCRWVVSGKSANCCVWPKIFFYWLQPPPYHQDQVKENPNRVFFIKMWWSLGYIRLFFHLPLTVTTNSRIKGQKRMKETGINVHFVPLKSYTQLKILAHYIST